MINGGQNLNNGGNGVTSLNALIGAIQLMGGTNVTLDVVGNTITINATAGGAGIASINGSTAGAQTLVSSDTNLLTINTAPLTGITTFTVIGNSLIANGTVTDTSVLNPGQSITLLVAWDTPFLDTDYIAVGNVSSTNDQPLICNVANNTRALDSTQFIVKNIGSEPVTSLTINAIARHN